MHSNSKREVLAQSTLSHYRGAACAAAAGLSAVAWAEWLSALAALVHLWQTPVHLELWGGYGLFFLGAAAFQAAYALTLERWHRHDWFLTAGIAANASIVVLWIVSRTAGMPRPGPDSGHVHAIGLADGLATLCEIGLVVALAVIFLRASAPPTANNPPQ